MGMAGSRADLLRASDPVLELRVDLQKSRLDVVPDTLRVALEQALSLPLTRNLLRRKECFQSVCADIVAAEHARDALRTRESEHNFFRAQARGCFEDISESAQA